MFLDIIRLLLISMILLFCYFLVNNYDMENNKSMDFIYGKGCMLKKFKREMIKNNLYYKIDNILLKMNFLQPIIFSIIPSDLKSKVQNEYNNRIESELFTFSDGGNTMIEYLYARDRNKPFIYFTNTFGVDGFGSFYLYRMMLILNKQYNCVFLYSRGYKLPINNDIIYLCNINEDLNEIIEHVINKNKTNDHILVGISMGSNSFCNYLCNYKNKRIKGFVSICNPLDLLTISHSETFSFINNLFINKLFKINMKKYILNNFKSDEYIINNINILLEDLDLFFIKLLKPYCKKKYKSFNDFCYNNSCINTIEKLETPSLFIFSKDDCVTPISKTNIEKLKKNNNIFQLHTKYGSHVAHYDDDGKIWLVDIIDKYIKYILPMSTIKNY